MDYLFVITATAENILRMLQRIASLLTRNRLKIQHMNVIEMNGSGFAYLSFALRTDEESIEKLIKQLRKMPDLLEIKISHKLK